MPKNEESFIDEKNETEGPRRRRRARKSASKNEAATTRRKRRYTRRASTLLPIYSSADTSQARIIGWVQQ